MKAFPQALAAIVTILFTSLGPGCSEGRETSSPSLPPVMRPTLSFYKIPECFLCAELTDVLVEQEKIQGTKMNFRTVDYHSPASQEAIRRFQLGSHGIVIHDPQGDQLWSLQAHHRDSEALVNAITQVVGDDTSGQRATATR